MALWILSDRNEDGVVIDAYPKAGVEEYRYLEGEPLAAEHGNGATLKFSPNYPHRRKLYDFVSNTVSLRIVSARVRQVVQALGVKDVEFLPVALADHNRDVVATDYFIMNPVSFLEVIDMERSEYRRNAILKTEILRIQKLVLKTDIQPQLCIFRPLHLRRVTMMDQVVYDAFRDAGLVGYEALPAEGWDGRALSS
jgi:hypothetical protein